MANDWHPADIKAAVQKRGTTLSAIARAEGVAPQVLSIAVHSRVSGPAERAIAAAIGHAPQDIWPSRYDAHGHRIMFRTITGPVGRSRKVRA